MVAAAAALALCLLPAAAPAAHRAGGTRTACPKAWAKGWLALAKKVQAPVYCPTWMPNPLDGHIGGEWQDIYSIGKDRSYLVGFLYHGEGASGDVHVNFRGYPGRTRIPRCRIVVPISAGKIRNGIGPCFADPRGRTKANGITATVYTVNQDADQWHVLFAWRRAGTLYTVSEHVIRPYNFSHVVKNLDALLRGLVLVRPAR